jgi:ENTS family enterobactin (siderophore) exporter
MLISVALMPLGLVILGASGAAFLAFLGLAGFGLGRALNDILRFAVLQQNTPDELRGRVSSLWMVQAVTGTAIGSMAAGFLGQWLEPGTALLALGLAGLALGLILLATLGSVRRVTSEVIVLDRPETAVQDIAVREKEGSS